MRNFQGTVFTWTQTYGEISTLSNLHYCTSKELFRSRLMWWVGHVILVREFNHSCILPCRYQCYLKRAHIKFGETHSEAIFHMIFFLNLQVDSAFLVFGHTNSKLSLKHPWGITIDKDNRIYVTDYGNHRVIVYNQFGSSIREFGSKGSKDGYFNGPTGIAIDQSGMIYVADWDNHRVQYFSPDNNYFMGKFGSKGMSPSFKKIIRFFSTNPLICG